MMHCTSWQLSQMFCGWRECKAVDGLTEALLLAAVAADSRVGVQSREHSNAPQTPEPEPCCQTAGSWKLT